MKPEDVIGPAAVKALTDAGYTLVPPKEQKRLVRMEESVDRCHRHGGAWGLMPEQTRALYNAADDWLVKTVNRRIVDGIGLTYAGANFVMIADLLRLFCGEEDK